MGNSISKTGVKRTRSTQTESELNTFLQNNDGAGIDVPPAVDGQGELE